MNRIDYEILQNSMQGLSGTLQRNREFAASRSDRAEEKELRRQMLERQIQRDQQSIDLKRYTVDTMDSNKDADRRQKILDSGAKSDAASAKLDLDAQKIAGQFEQNAQKNQPKYTEKLYDPQFKSVMEIPGTFEQHQQIKAKFREMNGYDLEGVPKTEKVDPSKHVKMTLPGDGDDASVTIYIPTDKLGEYMKRGGTAYDKIKKAGLQPLDASAQPPMSLSAPSSAAAPAKPSAQVPSTHIDFLRSNPSPKVIADFEAKYGAGSAAQYLK